VTKSDFLCSGHFSLDKRDDIGYSCSVGLGRGSGPAGKVMPESPFLLSSVVPACGFCLQVQSRSRGVKESRSWKVETNRRPSRCSRGVKESRSWQANRPARLSGRSLGRQWAIPGLRDSAISRPRKLSSEPGGTTKTQNNTNEASMLLKTHGAIGKRTQNELKNEPNLRRLGRELMPNSEVARLKGKKPVTWLATLDTLSPGKRAADKVWPGYLKATRENTKIAGTKPGCL